MKSSPRASQSTCALTPLLPRSVRDGTGVHRVVTLRYLETGSAMTQLSPRHSFSDVDWTTVPDEPGVYVIYDLDEVIYVGMAGRNGKGSLRNRLKDHASGQIVNMFAQYLFLDRVQFVPAERITHPRAAKAACHEYLKGRCAFRFVVTRDGRDARALENQLRMELKPTLNP